MAAAQRAAALRRRPGPPLRVAVLAEARRLRVLAQLVAPGPAGRQYAPNMTCESRRRSSFVARRSSPARTPDLAAVDALNDERAVLLVLPHDGTERALAVTQYRHRRHCRICVAAYAARQYPLQRRRWPAPARRPLAPATARRRRPCLRPARIRAHVQPADGRETKCMLIELRDEPRRAGVARPP